MIRYAIALARTATPPAFALALLLALPGLARAQLFGELQEKAEKAAERVIEAKETADRYGAAVAPISTGQELAIGAGIAATVAGHYGVVRDTALTRYVGLVGAAVAEQAPARPGILYRFAVLDTDEVNAFASPGGWIFVTRGALAAMEDEATLAGVLAHEVGHVVARDVIDEIRSRATTRLGIEEAAERVDWAGEDLLRAAVETGSEALFMGLSRDDEIHADAFGVKAAAAAGYDPEGLARFVAALEAAEGEERVSLLEKTHPDPDERSEAIASAVKRLPPGGAEATLAARFAERTAGIRALPGR